ncbi:MAG: GNAT family N-acetyltransferase, partial [Candidatus Zixiibacteriota bacterium]
MSENPKQSLSSEKPENLDNLIIEKMKKEDLDQVVRIERHSFSDPWKKDFFSQDIDNPSALPLVARANNRVVGYICLWMILDEIQMSNIAVSP